MPSLRASICVLAFTCSMASVAYGQSAFHRGPSLLPLPPTHRQAGWNAGNGYEQRGYPPSNHPAYQYSAAGQHPAYAPPQRWGGPAPGPAQAWQPAPPSAPSTGYPAATPMLMAYPNTSAAPQQYSATRLISDVPLAGPRPPQPAPSPWGPSGSVLTQNRAQNYTGYYGEGPAAPAPGGQLPPPRPAQNQPAQNYPQQNFNGYAPEPGFYGMGPVGPDMSACGYGACDAVPVYAPSPWFGSVSGLFMTRDNENKYFFSYDDANEARQLTNARDVNFDLSGGIDLRFGRYFNCGQDAIEVGYWGIYPDAQETVTPAHAVHGSLNGILNWDQLSYGDDGFGNAWTADEYVNNANAHVLRRNSEVHNIELNWLHFCGFCGHGKGCHCSRLQHHWLLGVRFFKFHDHLTFGSESYDGNGAFRYEYDELYYDINLDNNLIGVQVGGLGEYNVNCKWSLDYGVKFGVYANHINHRSAIGGSQGLAWINNGPNYGIDFLVENSKTDVSFLGELNLGATRCFGNCWAVTFGYRVVAVTGIAHPTDQIYHDLRGIQDVQWIDSNGSLLLHGGYLGVEYNR